MLIRGLHFVKFEDDLLPREESRGQVPWLLLSAVGEELPTDCTVDRWGFQRSGRSTMGFGGRWGGVDVSAHDPDALGGSMIGYWTSVFLLLASCKLVYAGMDEIGRAVA